jgi:hypothetical protein
MEKNSADVGIPEAAGGLGIPNYRVIQEASPDGERVTFASFIAFAGAKSAPGTNQYLATRGPQGWTTNSINLPGRGLNPLQPAFRGFSPDLSLGAAVGVEPPLTPDASPDFQNLYLQENTSGALQTLTPASPIGPLEPKNYCVGFGGMTTDGSHALVFATGALTPEASPAAGINLYEWSRDEGLKLVNILPGPIVARPTALSGFGAQRPESAKCGNAEAIEKTAISSDGSKVFWTYVPPQSKEEEEKGERKPTRLLALLDGSEPIQIDARQGGPDTAGEGNYWGAAADGSTVVFTDPRELTANANTGPLPNPSKPFHRGGAESNVRPGTDLYRYDFQTGSLEDLSADSSEPTGANVRGVVGMSEDTDWIYFVATGVLTSEENARHERAQSGANNLYLWHEGDPTRFVASLSGIDSSDWSPSPKNQTARSTADGEDLAFMSAAPLTEYDSRIAGSQTCPRIVGEAEFSTSPNAEVACEESYLFNAESGDLTCVSCNPTNSRPTGPSMLPVWNSGFEQPRYLNDDGSRVFFESIDSLLPQDVNRRRDVYEWERAGSGICSAQSPTFNVGSGGCLFLISSGTSGVPSFLIDASADGSDVFISTRQRLVTQDDDDHYDVYDARVGGGFPPSPSAAPACETETECRGISQVAPSEQVPATATSPSEGNVKSPIRHRHGSRRCRRRRHPAKSEAKRLCSPEKSGHHAKKSRRHHS